MIMNIYDRCWYDKSVTNLLNQALFYVDMGLVKDSLYLNID